MHKITFTIRVFVEEAHSLLSVTRSNMSLPRMWCANHNTAQREIVLPKKAVLLSWKTAKSRRTLLDRVVWCIAFAEVNATALRKLCKKADKNLGNTHGQQFLQVCVRVEIRTRPCVARTTTSTTTHLLQMCWESNSPRLHAVLRSTLIAELRALESRLLHTLPRSPDASDCDSLTISVEAPSDVSSNTPAVDTVQHTVQQSTTPPSATEAAGYEFAFTVRGIPEDALQCAVCMVCGGTRGLVCVHNGRPPVYCSLNTPQSPPQPLLYRVPCMSPWRCHVATTFVSHA